MGNCCNGRSTEDLSRLTDDDDNNSRSVDYNSSTSSSDSSAAGGQYVDSSTRSTRGSNTSDRRVRTLFIPAPGGPIQPNEPSDEADMKATQRYVLIQRLPVGLYDTQSKKERECAICMIEFEAGDKIKYLPCMHVYHKDCVDEWLVRSFTCPSCMEPVDAALLSSFDSY